MITRSFPDTLFLSDRVRLAMDSLEATVDEQTGLPYCLFDILSTPPRRAHTCFDWSDHTARTIDALLLGKALTGHTGADGTVRKLETVLDAGFGEDGLHYTPDNEWTAEQANTHYQRSVINALLSRVLANGEDKAKTLLVGLLHGLKSISIKRDGFWYFPAVEHLRGGWFRGDWDILGYGVDPANTNGRLIYGLCRAHELLRDDVSAELAKNYAYHVMRHSSAYLPDGGFATGMEFREGHFHSRAVTMLGVIHYGATFGDREALEWGRMVFDKAAGYGSRFGWFPERLVKERAHGCETCAVVDMMEAAMLLAGAGWPEYWDAAERFLFNQLVESQVTSLDALVRARKENGQPDIDPESLRPFVGGFAGWSAPNDLLSKVMHNWDLYLCCCAQGVRGMFNAWTNAVRFADGGATVNLHMNYADSRITVRSLLPGSGRLEVIPEADCRVRVRIPGWARGSSFRAETDGAAVLPETGNGYADFGMVAAGGTVAVEFPVAETRRTERILDAEYTTEWRGNTVVSISPEGTMMPLYQGRTKAADGQEMERTIPVIPFTLQP